MKILIWFGCFFVNAIIQVMLKNMGITLGAIPVMLLFGASYWSARKLCQKWDERKGDSDEES